MATPLPEDTEADVLWDQDRTEAELIADLRPGQVGSIASDTGNYVQRLNDGTLKVLGSNGKIVSLKQDSINTDIKVTYDFTEDPELPYGNRLDFRITTGQVGAQYNIVNFTWSHGVNGTGQVDDVFLSSENSSVRVSEPVYTAGKIEFWVKCQQTDSTLGVSVDHYLGGESGVVTFTGGTYVGDPLANTAVQETGDLKVSDPSSESTSGVATEQDVVNTENASSITTIFDELLKLQNASMQLVSAAPFQVGIDEANGNVWDFDISIPSSNTDVLDADAVTDRISYKLAGVRYTSTDTVVVKKLTSQDKILWVRAYDDSDDSPLGDATQRPVDWSTGDSNTITLSELIEPLSPDLVFYFKSWGTRSDGTTPDDGIEITSIISTIESQGSGAGTGKWKNSTLGSAKILETIETDYDSIVAGSPSDYSGTIAKLVSSVAPVGGESLIVSGGTQDGTYLLEGAPDQFGFDVYKRTNPSVMYISKDSGAQHAYWCIDETINPNFFDADYNYTGATPDGEYSNPINPPDTCVVSLSSGESSTGIATNGDIVTSGNVLINGQGLSIAGGQALIGFVPNASGDLIMGFDVSEVGGNSNVLYSFGSNLVPRFSIPAPGAGKTTQMYRSVALGAYTVGNEDSTLDTDSANLSFDNTFLDFNTGSVGEEAKPDLGVAGSMQVKDGILVGELQSSGDRVLIKDGRVQHLNDPIEPQDAVTKKYLSENSIGLVNANNSLQDRINQGYTVFNRDEGTHLIEGTTLTFKGGKTYNFLDTYGTASGSSGWFFSGVDLITTDSGTANLVFDGNAIIDSVPSAGNATNISGCTITARELLSLSTEGDLITDSRIEVSKLLGFGTVTTTNAVIYEQKSNSEIIGTGVQQYWRTPVSVTTRTRLTGWAFESGWETYDTSGVNEAVIYLTSDGYIEGEGRIKSGSTGMLVSNLPAEVGRSETVVRSGSTAGLYALSITESTMYISIATGVPTNTSVAFSFRYKLA